MSFLSSSTARVENPVSTTTAPSAPEKTTTLFRIPHGNASRWMDGATCATSKRIGVKEAPRDCSQVRDSACSAS